MQRPDRSQPPCCSSVRAEAQELLLAGRIAHFGFVHEDQPYVIPLVYFYSTEDPGSVYIHSARHGRAIQAAASGAPLCLTITEVDVRVYGPEASDHSLNYRCVMVFGRGTELTDAGRKQSIMHGTVARYFDEDGSAHVFEPVSEKYLANTMVVAVAIEEVSAKARRGGARAGEPEVGGTLPW